MQSLISIIIPTFNRAHLLGATLDSILEQSYKNWECIVVDDGSTDVTLELMDFYTARDKRIQYISRPKNRPKGANACRNYGLEISKGEYINWFDSDDLIHPLKLQIQIEKVENGSIDFSVCNVNIFENFKNNILNNWQGKIESENLFFDYLKGNINWMTPSILWKRSFLQKIEKWFDEELQASQEWEFHVRVINYSPIIHIEKKSLVYIRKNINGITYNKDWQVRTWFYFLARLKVYKNRDLNLSNQSIQFLQNYLLSTFKKMIRTKNPAIFKAYNQYILTDSDFDEKTKIISLFSVFSYKFFNRGNCFLQNIKY